MLDTELQIETLQPKIQCLATEVLMLQHDTFPAINCILEVLAITHGTPLQEVLGENLLSERYLDN